MKKNSLIIFLIWISMSIVNAQHVSNIDSLKITPNTPTTSDTVLVKVRALFYSYPCSSDSATVITNGLETKVTAYFQSGIGATSSYCKDTISLGRLSAGVNTLIFRLYNTAYKDEDIDTVMFFVSPTSNASLIDPHNSIGLYPNPAQDQLFFYSLRTLTGTYRIKLYTAIGQLMYEKEITDRTEAIDIRTLAKGLYCYQIIGTNTTNITTGKLIKE